MWSKKIAGQLAVFFLCTFHARCPQRLSIDGTVCRIRALPRPAWLRKAAPHQPPTLSIPLKGNVMTSKFNLVLIAAVLALGACSQKTQDAASATADSAAADAAAAADKAAAATDEAASKASAAADNAAAEASVAAEKAENATQEATSDAAAAVSEGADATADKAAEVSKEADEAAKK